MGNGTNTIPTLHAGAAAWHLGSMTRTLQMLSLLAGAALLQAWAPGAPPPLSRPVAGWVLDYGDTACTASRTYGSAGAPVTLAFRPSPNGKLVRMILVRPEKAEGAVQFPLATNIADKALSALRFESGDKAKAIVWANFERAALDRLPAAGELALRGERFVDARFAVPATAAVLKELDICSADLRRHWNVDGAGATLSRPAAPLKPLAQYFSPGDYPEAAVRRNSGGTSVVTVMVDETGAPRDCLVEQSSGVASLDATTCVGVLQRARFRAAMDGAGKAVRSVLTSRVVWVIAEEW